MFNDKWFEELYGHLAEACEDKVKLLTHCQSYVPLPYIYLEKQEAQSSFNRLSVWFNFHIMSLYEGEKQVGELSKLLREKLRKPIILGSCVVIFKQQKVVPKVVDRKIRQLTLIYQGLINFDPKG